MNIPAIIQKATAIFSLLPTIIAGMKTLQETGLPGAQKLDLLKGVLQGLYTAEQDTVIAFNDIWPTVEGLVAKLKASQLFAKPEPTPPAQ